MRRFPDGTIPAAAATIACLLATLWPATSLAADEDDTRQQLREVNQAIERIEQWMASARNDRSEQEQAIHELGERIEEQRGRIETNRQRIREREATLEALRERQQALQQTLEDQQETIARSLRAAWMNSNDSALRLLLNQQDPSRAARLLHYHARANEARAERLREYRATLEELAANRRRSEEAARALERDNAQLREDLAALEADREQRQALIDDIESRLARRGDRLEQLREDRSRLQELIDEINRIVVDIPPPERLSPFADARGNMPWPLDGQPLNRFGATYGDGNLQRQGLIIEAEADTPVRAIHPGRVVFADWLRGSGRLVVIEHGDRYMSLYGHNGSLNKQQGDWVNRGEVIATAGSDAGTGRPGVYLEIRHNGDPQDPAQWLAER